ncbi:hypothetical protein [Actinomadura macrotermitis]|uniref:Uncharacterized protein n=1 Tax=Actinomadura macrotermitis TaxID=2585200 RepID=A0A7K0BU80_9ACTN|nr:hypothetical protein [Actinomadura macrotermitis]MQY04452.1 hypothetical protein [Actinomadura macrotermitis]
MSENEPLGPVEQDALLQDVVLLLTHALPSNWQEARVRYDALGSHSAVRMQIQDLNRPFPALAPPPDELADLFAQLRAGMYRPGLGTWFSVVFSLTFPFTYNVEYDYKSEPRFDGGAPAGARAEELRLFPRDSDKTPAWLAPGGPAPALRTAAPFDGRGPDGRPVVQRPPVPGDQRDALLHYLEQAPVVLAARSHDTDVLDPGRAQRVPLTFHTDGTWIWPGAVGYYLRVHGLPPQPELVEHVRAAGFRVPEVPEDARSAAVAAITGQRTA